MTVADMLREAADVLYHTRCGAQAAALADVFLHEAQWAESDPFYAHRPEVVSVAAARVVLHSSSPSPGRTSRRPGRPGPKERTT
jgi:hypothetical protein